MHRLAYRIVAAERERHVAHAAADVRMRTGFADLRRRLDKVDRVVVVLFDAGRHGKNIRIEDDVFRREASLLRQHCVRTLADFHFALDGVGLAFLVERHHDDGRAIRTNLARVLKERHLRLP